MRGLKARTNFVYPTHETCLLSAAAALAAPNGTNSTQHHQVDLIAQKTLGEVLLLSASNKPRNFDWHSNYTSQLSYEEPSRNVFNRPANSIQKHQLMDEHGLPGHGCRYVDRKIQPASVPMRPVSPGRMPGVQQLHHSMQHATEEKAPLLHPFTSPLLHKVEVEGFRVSPGRREQWHCVTGDTDHHFRHLNQFERSPIVNSELFVSRYCGAGSQPFQVCELAALIFHAP